MASTFRIAALEVLASLAASAGNARLVSAADPSSLVRAVQGARYKAVLTTDSTGDPKITSGLKRELRHLLLRM